MAKKISELTAATTPVGAQLCVIQDAQTKRLPVTALGGAAVATEGTLPLYDASGRLVANGILGNEVDAHVTVDLIARGLQSRDDRSGYPTTRLLMEASGIADDTVYDVVIPAAKAGTVAMTSDILPTASQVEAEAGTATNRVMTPLRVAQAIAALAGSGLTFDVRNFGALGDTRKVTDAVTNGTTTVTSATAAFTAGDVGKSIWGNDTSGNSIIPFGTIVSVTNSTTIVVSAAATSTASSVIMVFGTDDSDAIIAANAAAEAAEPRGAVYLPAGGYLYSKFLFDHDYAASRIPPAIIGDGSQRTIFYESADFDYGTTGGSYYSTFVREINTNACLWRGFTVDGATFNRDSVHVVATLAGGEMTLREDVEIRNFRQVLYAFYIAGAGEVWRNCRVRYISTVGIQCAGGGEFMNCYVGDCGGVGLVVTATGRFHWTGGTIDESTGGSATFDSVTDLRFCNAMIFGPASATAVALTTAGTMRAVNTSIKPFGSNNNTTGLSVGSGCTAYLSQCDLAGSGTGYGINNAGTVYDGGNNVSNSKAGTAISASSAL